MATHTATLNDRAGKESGAIDALQKEHSLALVGLKEKIDAEHKEYIESTRVAHQSELATLQEQYTIRSKELEKQLEELQAKYDTEVTALKSNLDSDTKTLRDTHSEEIEALKKSHGEEIVALEVSIQV